MKIDDKLKQEVFDSLNNGDNTWFDGGINDIENFLISLKSSGIYFEDGKFFHDGKTPVKGDFYLNMLYNDDLVLHASIHKSRWNKDLRGFHFYLYKNKEQQIKAKNNLFLKIMGKPITQLSLNDLEFLDKNFNDKYLELKDRLFGILK